MNRENTLAIRLTPEERAAAERLAERERLPLSTLGRRVLLQMAESAGCFETPTIPPVGIAE